VGGGGILGSTPNKSKWQSTLLSLLQKSYNSASRARARHTRNDQHTKETNKQTSSNQLTQNIRLQTAYM